MPSLKELPSKEFLDDIIDKTRKNAWNAPFLYNSVIENWLKNFTGKALVSSELSEESAEKLEQNIALFLLCNYIYLNEREVRHLMKNMLNSFIHTCFELSSSSVDETAILEIIKRTEFRQLGNSSESSAYLLYLFRQENELSKFDFQKKPKCDYLVFIDDFSISGKQASRYIKSFLKNHSEYKEKKIIVLLMVSTPDAVAELNSIQEGITVLPCIILDDSAKLFSDSSIVFNGYSSSLKEDAQKMCKYYGNKILTESNKEEGITEFGYESGGYLIGTYYNTPNNTLPIIWSDFNWKCLFRRYEKQYRDDSFALPGGGYV